MIMNWGVKVYFNGFLEIFCIDYWCCCFIVVVNGGIEVGGKLCMAVVIYE